MKAIVVEDERLPRLALLRKLEDFRQQVEVVDSCDNYDDALESILHHKPDLLLMDIQLQGRDAIELLGKLQEAIELPQVIFTTAYSDRRFLMSAIKFSAVDYLLKPIDKNELALAITKAANNLSLAQPHPTAIGKLSLRTANGKVYILPADIAYISADGNYSTLCTFSNKEQVLESMSTLEQLLDPTIFVRIDRSTIVNLQRVYKVNVKRHVCTFISTTGMVMETELSKIGIDRLMQYM